MSGGYPFHPLELFWGGGEIHITVRVVFLHERFELLDKTAAVTVLFQMNIENYSVREQVKDLLGRTECDVPTVLFTDIQLSELVERMLCDKTASV